MTENQEKPDHFVYRWLSIYADSMRFFIAATKHYHARLEEELKRIASDPLFSELFLEKEMQSTELWKETERFRIMAERLEKKVEEFPGAWDYDLDLRHQDVRVLKALGMLYLTDLLRRRDVIASEGSFSTIAIQALDSKTARFAELLSLGVFKDATPWPLLIGESQPPLTRPLHVQALSPANVESPPVRVLSTIEISDPQLRERCLDLLQTFEDEEQAHRYDTVITEATRILEDRVRRLSGADMSVDGVNLMTFAFGGDPSRMLISNDPAEQQAAHLMFRGVFGFIRNPFHHRLIGDLARERVLQMLGLVDYLLFLVQGASRSSQQDA